MACKPCAERRKALREKLLAKTKARKHVQAAAISAVLVASEAVGKVLGIGEGIGSESTRRYPTISDQEDAV